MAESGQPRQPPLSRDRAQGRPGSSAGVSFPASLPSLGLSPTLPLEAHIGDSLASLSLPLSLHPCLPPSQSLSLRPSHHPLTTPPPGVLALLPFSPSYFVAVTSQRLVDVRPQSACRDLGFQSEIFYFCITGWAPSLRQKKCCPHRCLCLHLRGWDLPLPPGMSWGPTGTSGGSRWAQGCLGRAACLCGTVQQHPPGPSVTSPCCMADTLPRGPVTATP